MRRRSVAAAAVGGTLVLSLTGCLNESGPTGAGDVKLTAAQAMTRVSQKTGEADTFIADLTFEGGGVAGADTKIRADGRFRLRPTLGFSGRLQELSHGGRRVPGAAGQGILTGDTLYVKLPRLARSLSTEPWARIDLERVRRLTGLDLNQVIRRADPAEQTKMFTGSRDVRRVGTETVDGVETTHYTGTVTLREALRRLAPQEQERLRRVHPDGADATIGFDLWAGRDRLPRKLVTRIRGRQGESGTLTVLYRDYGTPVTINPPPADQVGRVPLGEPAGGLGG